MTPFHFKEQLQSPRLKLVKIRMDLAQTMFDLIIKEKERLCTFLPWPKFINILDDEIKFVNDSLEKWNNKTCFTYNILLKDQSYLGNISVFNFNWEKGEAEIGYWLSSSSQGKGLMSEAVKTIGNELRINKFKKLHIKTLAHNLRSQKVALSCGFTDTQKTVIQNNESLKLYTKDLI